MPIPNALEGDKYVLLTAAYNEEKYIERAIESTLFQTIRPAKWVIISDGSTDRTDEIVLKYSRKYAFIRLLRIVKEHPRNFAAQVLAIREGYRLIRQLDFGFIGNMDSDVAMDRWYFEELLNRFRGDSTLGLAGGFIFERSRNGFQSRAANSTRSVAHAAQMFRRACFESIGGYVPLRYGGPDWLAEVRARQSGWRVRAYPDLPVYHFRPTAGAEGLLVGCWRQGKMDYSVGSVLPFEIVKCGRRLCHKPLIVGGITRFLAFCSSYCRKNARLVPPNVVQYVQNEQWERLRDCLYRRSSTR